MAISITSKGRTLKDDLEHGGVAANAYLKTFNDRQKGKFINAIAAVCDAMDVDTNGTHATSFTIAASLASNSCSITIS